MVLVGLYACIKLSHLALANAKAMTKISMTQDI